MAERWAILVLLAVAAAGWSAFLSLSEPHAWLPLGALFTTIALLAWWAGADAKAKGIAGLQYIEGVLLLLFAPAGLGMYLVRSRGLAVGLVSLLGFAALYLAALIGGEWLALNF